MNPKEILTRYALNLNDLKKPKRRASCDLLTRFVTAVEVQDNHGPHGWEIHHDTDGVIEEAKFLNSKVAKGAWCLLEIGEGGQLIITWGHEGRDQHGPEDVEGLAFDPLVNRWESTVPLMAGDPSRGVKDPEVVLAEVVIERIERLRITSQGPGRS